MSARRLTVVLFDQGITIPKSLPMSLKGLKIIDSLRRVLGREPKEDDTSQDGAAIGAAMDVARSSTGLAHRGKGLEDIRMFIDACESGRLRIMSRCGEFIYQRGEPIIIRSHPFSVGGTLIEWEVTLPPRDEDRPLQ